MKLLHIGDVVGAAGSRFLQERLPNIKRTHKIDMTVVNGETPLRETASPSIPWSRSFLPGQM